MTTKPRTRTGMGAAGLPSVMIACMALLGLGAPAQAQDAGAEAQVLDVVRTLFDAMREKDEAALRSVFHPTARLQSAGTPGQVTPIDGFIRSILGNDTYLDEVTFDEQVLVNGGVAVAWTPYNFFAGETFSHCGVDAFTLVRTAQGWKIVQIVDTRVQEGCDPSRRG